MLVLTASKRYICCKTAFKKRPAAADKVPGSKGKGVFNRQIYGRAVIHSLFVQATLILNPVY